MFGKKLSSWGKGLALTVIIALVAVGCSSGGTGNGDTNNAAGGNGGGKAVNKSLKLAYVAWESEIASTHVVEHVLEKELGYNVEMLQVDAGPMWAGVSDGSADAMVAAWLPTTHASYYTTNEGKFDDLGPNLDGTKIGLVVPTYMDISSLEDLTKPEVGDALNKTITGIEPGAGIMMATEEAVKVYGLDGWTVLESSSAAMAAELQSAYKDQKPIVITGWTPHWKFASMDLKYLEDPQGVYGGDEQIHTIVRKGLEQDDPVAYKFLDQFTWSPDDMAEVMIQIQEGASPEEAAAAWVEANPDKVNAWLEGVE